MNHSSLNHLAVFVPVFPYVFKDVEEVSRQAFTINKLQLIQWKEGLFSGRPTSKFVELFSCHISVGCLVVACAEFGWGRIVFIVAGIRLCFGFVLSTRLIVQRSFCYC